MSALSSAHKIRARLSLDSSAGTAGDSGTAESVGGDTRGRVETSDIQCSASYSNQKGAAFTLAAVHLHVAAVGVNKLLHERNRRSFRIVARHQLFLRRERRRQGMSGTQSQAVTVRSVRLHCGSSVFQRVQSNRSASVLAKSGTPNMLQCMIRVRHGCAHHPEGPKCGLCTGTPGNIC